MAIPEVRLPVDVEDIPKELERLRAALAGAQGEVKIIRSMIGAVQDLCPHETTRTHKSYGDDVGDTYCTHCGKENV